MKEIVCVKDKINGWARESIGVLQNRVHLMDPGASPDLSINVFFNTNQVFFFENLKYSGGIASYSWFYRIFHWPVTVVHPVCIPYKHHTCFNLFIFFHTCIYKVILNIWYSKPLTPIWAVTWVFYIISYKYYISL